MTRLHQFSLLMRCCITFLFAMIASSSLCQAQTPSTVSSNADTVGFYTLADNSSIIFQATPSALQHLRETLRGTGITIHPVQTLDAGTPEGLRQIQELAKSLDLRQIHIQIQFVTVPPTAVSAASDLSPTAYLAQLVNAGASIVNSPLITTSNNIAASAEVQRNVPYLGVTRVGNKTTPSTNYFTAVSRITVTPHVNDDGGISLKLAGQLSQVGPAPEIDKAPSLTAKSIGTVRTIHSGDTIILGGVTQKTKETTLIFLSARVLPIATGTTP